MNFNGNNDRYVAGAGTTALGTIGTVLGGAALLNNGNGGLGGLLGGGNNSKLQEVMSENAMLKSQKYSDEHDAEIYGVIRNLETRQATTEAEVKCLKQELTTYELSQKEILDLKGQLTDCKINGVAKDLNCLAGKVETGFIGINNRFGGIDLAIAGFTKTVIRQSAICDTDGCGGGCPQQ